MRTAAVFLVVALAGCATAYPACEDPPFEGATFHVLSCGPNETGSFHVAYCDGGTYRVQCEVEGGRERVLDLVREDAPFCDDRGELVCLLGEAACETVPCDGVVYTNENPPP